MPREDNAPPDGRSAPSPVRSPPPRTLGALHPRLDAARMLLAANGSIVRGFIGAAVVTALVAGLAARLGRAVMPRLVVAGRVVGALAVVAALANIATWTVGLDRRDVEFVSDGARLEGTLMLPSAVGDPPVAIIVHGSAALAREFYAVWGRHLVLEGIGVFVYDKRGTGASDGVIPRNNDTTDYLTQLGRDAAAAFAAVQSQPGIDARRISMIGISQGGWTVPVAAALRAGVFRLAFLSGPVATTHEERAFSDVAGDGGSGFDDAAAIRLETARQPWRLSADSTRFRSWQRPRYQDSGSSATATEAFLSR